MAEQPQTLVVASAFEPGRRLFWIVLLLALEGLLIFVHVRDAERSYIARWAAAYASIFIAIGYPRIRRTVFAAPIRLNCEPISWRSLAGHAAAMGLFLFLSSPALVNSISGATAVLVLGGWLAAGVCGIAGAALTFVRRPVWSALLRATGKAWIYAAAGAFAASEAAPYLWRVWDRYMLQSAIAVTFAAVRTLIGSLLPGMIVDPITHEVGGQNFQITLAGPCSGWEGVGLAVVFTILWLWVSRRDCRFPHALLLIPAAMAAMFLLNILRIAALIIIGERISARVAMSGFHSQAGWIAFNAVALGIAWIAPRVNWLRTREPERAGDTTSRTAPNRTIPYLLPFTMILAAGMVSRAAADQFEWMYPLRFFAAVIALWLCRREYATLLWRPGWLSVLAGAGVFVMWLVLDGSAHPDNGIAAGLAALPAPAKSAWIFFRVLAAVTTVPLAEELAFRGFLLRRLVSSEFELVTFRRFTLIALTASSLVFGLLHGERWLAGTVAGVVYAGVMLRRGSIGDAVTAHATTNALLAIWVLWGSHYYFW